MRQHAFWKITLVLSYPLKEAKEKNPAKTGF